MQEKNNSKYSLKDIGDAIARIISEVEGTGYIFGIVRTYHHNTLNKYTNVSKYTERVAIVKQGYEYDENNEENFDFCIDNNGATLWQKKKIAYIFKSKEELANKVNGVSFYDMFPYIKEFIEILNNYEGEINKEIANQLAIEYICKRNRIAQGIEGDVQLSFDFIKDNCNTDNRYYYKLSDIGDALAFIVSAIENKTYIFTTVNTYVHTRVNYEDIVPYYVGNLAIVEKGFEGIDYCTKGEKAKLWKDLRVALIFKSNLSNTSVSLYDQEIYFKNMFTNSAFPYLREYIELLSEQQMHGIKITKEVAFQLAISFITKKQKELEAGNQKKIV